MRRGFLLLCALAVTASAVAQSNYAAVSGTVRHSQSLAVADASVRFKALSTGATRVLTTNDSRFFYAPALLPDDYELTTTASGFAPVAQSLHLEVGQNISLDIALKIGAVKEGVQVSGAADVLRPTDASVGEVVEPKSIQELPLNGRMLIDLVLKVPGAHVGFGAQTGETNPLYWRPGQRSAVVIGGARDNANYFLFDGATNTDPTFNTQNFSPSPDSVMEFQVVTSSYTADLGGAGGGQSILLPAPGRAGFTGRLANFSATARSMPARLPAWATIIWCKTISELPSAAWGKEKYFLFPEL
jgi:Carboxypeptidase regulatory-like domain